MTTLAARIRRARGWRRFSQRKLADLCQVHKNTIASIEAGKNNNPSMGLFVEIGTQLDVNLLWLACRTDNHRRGIQYDSDAEYRNALAYRQMSQQEKDQLVEFMTDFHNTNEIARRGSPQVRKKVT